MKHLSFVWILPFLFQLSPVPADVITTYPAAGLTLIQDTRTDPAQRIFILKADLTKIRISASLGQDKVKGREIVSAMARRHGAFAAINADFTGTSGPWEGAPEGLTVIGGRVFAAPKYRTAIGFHKNGSVRVGKWLPPLTWSWPSSVRMGGAEHPIVLMNRDVNDGWICVFTRDFQVSGESIGNSVFTNVTEVFVDTGGRIREIRTDQSGAPIPEGWSVLVGRGTASTWLQTYARVNETAVINLQSVPPWQDYETIVGGGPGLLAGGVYVNDPILPFPDGEDFSVSGYKQPYYNTRHPRSGAGVSQDGKTLVLAVVDGRQTGASGMTLPEFADLLREYGAWEAVQFDSGGSATLYCDGAVLNSPSDGRERAICNALLLYPEEKPPLWQVR